MVLLEFNKPSCLSANINDLEGLRLRGEVDFYELLEEGSRMVFYWRGMGERQLRELNFTLLHEFVLNDCDSRTHVFYEYYDKEGS